MIRFEPPRVSEMLGPLFVDNALSDIPLFGPDKADVPALVKAALRAPMPADRLVVDEHGRGLPPLDLSGAPSVADKIQAITTYSRTHLTAAATSEARKQPKTHGSQDGPLSQRQRHERLLEERTHTLGLPSEGQVVLDHIMLLRAREMYLFNAATNQKIVADDPYLQDVWAWVAGMCGLFV
ncbi:hypothetical protein VTK73DRAFT_4493 [Phialemonium thermophilum]|uniref:Uncharacterized protein n=1 Tax=Phialemonium thermophilum TaxID=223376 RepID=A0ABR3V843_9PEZI